MTENLQVDRDGYAETPGNSPKASMALLSRELLEQIFKYVHDTSPSTVASLTQVCKIFYASAHPYKHRHQVFIFKGDMSNLPSRRSFLIIKELLENSVRGHILRNIRSITVDSMPNDAPFGSFVARTQQGNEMHLQAHIRKWNLLMKLIAKIPYLKTFTLKGTDQLPVILLDAMQQYHPRAHLHIQNWTRCMDNEDHNNLAEIALSRSPNLRSIQAQLGSTSSRLDLRHSALNRLVSQSPNLEKVDISDTTTEDFRRLDVDELEIQSRIRDEFRNSTISSTKVIRYFRSRGRIRLEALAEFVDYSKLKTLDIDNVFQLREESDNPNLFIQIPILNGRFPKLKHFSVSLNGRDKSEESYGAVETFLANCCPLQSLAIRNGASDLSSSAFLTHGSTLRTLILHDIEKADADLRIPIAISTICEIGKHCPVLEDITIDCGRLSLPESLNAVFLALATFTKLHTIRIYLPLGIADEAARTPHIFLDRHEVENEIEVYRRNPAPLNSIEGSCWMENIWSLLRQEKMKHQSCPLKELHVKVGEWERDLSVTFPAGWLIWEAANRRYFVATLHERDDRPNDINVYMKGTRPYSNLDSHEVRQIPETVDIGK